MALTHDYETEFVSPLDLTEQDVLVGECGGLSAVFFATRGTAQDKDYVYVSTEHGILTFYAPDGRMVEVLGDNQ